MGSIRHHMASVDASSMLLRTNKLLPETKNRRTSRMEKG